MCFSSCLLILSGNSRGSESHCKSISIFWVSRNEMFSYGRRDHGGQKSDQINNGRSFFQHTATCNLLLLYSTTKKTSFTKFVSTVTKKNLYKWHTYIVYRFVGQRSDFQFCRSVMRNDRNLKLMRVTNGRIHSTWKQTKPSKA